MIRGYRVWDNQEKTYSDKAFSIDQLGICYVQDEDGYWEEINDSRFIVEFETGLTDKNADMIYEGDIIKFGDSIATIVWRDKHAEFGVRWIDCGIEDSLDWQVGTEKTSGEVVGNIHEPPKDFRPEHLKRMGVTMTKGGEE